MISLLGQYLLLSSIVTGILCLVIRPKLFLILQSFCICAASGVLLYAFLTNDFSVQNVFLYSSTKQPIEYKVASLWANHNSSLLFWATLLSITATIGALASRNDITIKILALITTSLMFLIELTSSPFGLIHSSPTEGLGMNPVLQDMAITIHPPMLYLGYVVYIIPFGYFLTMLITQQISPSLMQKAYFASKLALTFLTTGISLGSWWAYRELGWGGYWFFDPVENISLIPWLLGLSLHHFFLIYNKKGAYLKTIIALGLSNFIIILLGMMLVRSGALISVHAFASNIRGGLYILGMFGAGIILILFLYVRRINTLIIQKQTLSFTLPDKGLWLGSSLTLMAAILILIGTIYPIVYHLFTRVTTSMNIQYFYLTFIPLGIVIALLALIIPHLSPSLKIKINTKNTAMMLSHIGIVILALGIMLNTLLQRDIEFTGKIGDILQQDHISISLRNISYSAGPNYYRQIGEFWVDYNNELTILKPENRLYSVENALSSESDIYSFVPYDLYAVLGSVEKDGTMHANIYIRPWMSLIWLGMILSALGFGVSCCRTISS